MSQGKGRNGGKPLAVKRLPVTFQSDRRRVITRFFDAGGPSRIQRIVQRIVDFSDAQVARLLDEVFQRFRTRHNDIALVLEQNYRNAMAAMGATIAVDSNRQLLIGSYFTMEYSIESAALFNPSIVLHIDQRNLPEGAVRFIMSLRATGEGHVSSIVFRTGVIYSNHEVQMDPVSRFSHPINVVPDKLYDKELFRRKLKDIRVPSTAIDTVLEFLNGTFTMTELEHAITSAQEKAPRQLQSGDAIQGIRWLARANYQLELPRRADASEMVIFPQTSNESRGIEDLRLVRFVNEDGSAVYYGTCTAYDGYRILPELVETADFLRIGVHTLNGSKAQNKGMALFPRRINGHYVMCSRIDGENLYVMYSDNVHFWENAELLQAPIHPWELVQIGNCGSPLETSEGWLLLTHGVGPMRTYCIGAMLLDLNNPNKVLGVLKEPLIVPNEQERDGYVPNVVYTCGALIHNKHLFIPFAVSDTATRFGMVAMERLLDRLLN